VRQTAWIMGGAIVFACGLLTARAPLSAQAAVSSDGVVASQSGGFAFPDGTVQTSAAQSAPLTFPDTGVRGCWDASGSSVDCPGTGQDGEYLSGVDWKAPRFIDNGDGTVLDTLTGLIWLRRADCFETDWEGALAAVGNLMSGSCDLTDGSLPGDWRLPNVRELLSLLDFGYSVDSLPAGHPFINISLGSSELGLYWTSTTLVALPGNAWTVGLQAPWTSFESKTSPQFVWPVRGGAEG